MTQSTPDSGARRRALATVGVMAFGRKDYDRAEAVQTRLVREAKEAREPVEVATALYNLANTYLARKEPERAVEALTSALEGCYFHGIDQMLALVYCNLGVALHRSGQKDDAFASFKIARDMFRAEDNIPSEAHVCDCLALLYYEDGRQQEAEGIWSYALSLYDRITDPLMQDVREGGRAAILQKLEHFGARHAA
ncbi:MAG: tetratricopeptide repeat protein [Pseudomonadota bacterium]